VGLGILIGGEACVRRRDFGRSSSLSSLSLSKNDRLEGAEPTRVTEDEIVEDFEVLTLID